MAERNYPNLETVRVGIIGYGGAFNMGKRHGESMQLTGRMKVVAVCDLDPARAAVGKQDFPDATIYTDLAQMLASEDLDLCTVILPHNLHAPVCIQCSEAGKHVVVEKPMCLSDAEAQAMIAAAQSNRAMLSVFHNRRWDGDFLALRSILVDQKLIGDVYHVEMFGGGYSKPGTWWRSYKAVSGGQFFDWGAHYLDWLLQLLPQRITGVTGFFHKLVWHEATNEDNVEAAIRFEDGAVAHIQMSTIAMVGKERWRILGTKGAILSGDKAFRVKADHHGYQSTFEVPHQSSNWDAYYANVADHLTAGADLIVKPEQARRVIAVMDTAEQSSAAGVTLPLPGE
ncbi:MAG: Gfo/Idh/MocA family oxidoreductase [Fimbriimonadaceae bacterium]|nr:Gfo/Idh/MocA family oxidoreductase [Fimbriimonadaceae bacterium]